MEDDYEDEELEEEEVAVKSQVDPTAAPSGLKFYDMVDMILGEEGEVNIHLPEGATASHEDWDEREVHYNVNGMIVGAKRYAGDIFITRFDDVETSPNGQRPVIPFLISMLNRLLRMTD